MTPQEYIESGLLELYAIGALGAEQMREVGDAVAAHPELRAELEEISRALEEIAPVEGVEPTSDLRRRVLADFSKGKGEVPVSSRSATSATVHRMPPTPPADPTPSRSPGRTWLLAASIAAFLVSTTAAIWLYNELETVEEQLASAEIRATSVESALARASDQLRRLRSANNRVVRMASANEQTNPSAFAVLYWDAETETVWIDAASMPELPEDQQYQLWAIPEGEDPVDAGVFDGSTEGLQQLKKASRAQVFAVTVEPRGGSETPTLETMTVIGEV